jgi:hypothetical protein
MATVAPPRMEDAFRVWLNTPVVVSISSRHEQVYALALDFRIAGAGGSEEEAIRDLARGLLAYFRASFAEGLSYEDAKRPVPMWRQAAESVGSVIRSLLPGSPPLPRRERFALPSILRNVPTPT